MNRVALRNHVAHGFEFVDPDDRLIGHVAQNHLFSLPLESPHLLVAAILYLLRRFEDCCEGFERIRICNVELLAVRFRKTLDCFLPERRFSSYQLGQFVTSAGLLLVRRRRDGTNWRNSHRGRTRDGQTGPG